MTKRRAPLSIDTALARIAGQLAGGWAEMAEVAGYAERTVRAWGDVDREEQINLPSAIKLDVAFQAAGGIGAPIYEAYGDMVEEAHAKAFGDRQELQRATIEFMRENNEAELALLEASQPDAGPIEEAKAQKELLDVRTKADELLLRMGRKPP
ncbi:hypothetical protein FIM10_04155 [Sphingomonadales bacterium 56]|uniref:hypothetical protein n=1 Tax=unclassified Sphingobium TaxID=2611147 RepID=UPI00191B6AC3|nr:MULTISPECIES: hypothetical protein [unclassified Sphingobium]MBY2927869.1 hypothetical protein [Sphingomonadales bacterium 56]MBY2957969.1 hypothetical protein [Sphingomonadales bacterium 58]CAD7336102.1 hypothetical protein SPHS6_00842 [Sphingobium sp. S6]CAD7336167.1 hypothetical protein SPHS8_00883 [Sphingobium sp. S8]